MSETSFKPEAPMISSLVHAPALGAGSVPRGYANSFAELDTIRGAGLDKNAVIRTASPAVALSGQPNVVACDSELQKDFVFRLFQAFEDISIRIFRRLVPEIGKHRALVVGQTVWRGQRVAYDASLLEPEDFSQPVVMPGIRSSSTRVLSIFQFQWEALLEGNPNLSIVEHHIEEEDFDYIAPPVATFATRFKHAQWSDLAFRAAAKMSKAVKFIPGARTIYVASAPELLKDAAPWLLRRNIWLHPLPALKIRTEASNEGGQHSDLSIIWDAMATTLRDVLKASVSPAAVEPSLRAIREAVVEDLSLFELSLAAWKEKIGGLRPRVDAIATATVGQPSTIALAAAAVEHNVPVIAFQHGATRELAADHDTNPIFFETQLADLFVCFNEQHAKHSQIDGRNNTRIKVTGAPAFYRPSSHHARQSIRAMPDIWYISSGIFLGAQDKLHRAMTDSETAAIEMGLIDSVLAACGKTVLYKPYPTRRFVDPDPIVEHAKSKDGITVVEHSLDLRYIVDRARLLMVSRTGSTIGYCLSKDIPLVYLQMPGRILRPAVREQMDRAVFFFDMADGGFADRLVALLRRPLAEIENEWQQRAEVRRNFIETYIAKSFAAGHSTAAAIESLLCNRN